MNKKKNFFELKQLLNKNKHTLMKVVDDPTGRMDKTMDEMLITK